MGDKNKLYAFEDTRLTYDAGFLLGQLADSLTQGRLDLPGEDGVVSVQVYGETEIEFKVTEKGSGDGRKLKLELELVWRASDAGEE
jgi:amphi-Trp domain-containing protein